MILIAKAGSCSIERDPFSYPGSGVLWVPYEAEQRLAAAPLDADAQ